MPEMFLECLLFSNIFPPTNPWFMADGGETLLHPEPGSLLRAQRPLFNQLTKKEVAGACF